MYSFQKYNLELKGWNKLFTTESNIPNSGKLRVIFKFHGKMEMSKNEIILLNKHFIQRSNNNNVILNKVTEEKIIIYYNFNKNGHDRFLILKEKIFWMILLKNILPILTGKQCVHFQFSMRLNSKVLILFASFLLKKKKKNSVSIAVYLHV